MPNINGCPQDNPDWAVKEDPAETFDFNNLDTRLYLALKSCVATMGNVQEAAEAKIVMRDFVASHGPLPDWAVDRNFGYELVPGAQLCTRDGRRTGNAHIISIEQKSYAHLADRNNPFGEIEVYNCLTDAGSKFVFTEQELNTAFTIGDWISDPARIIKDFDRNGEFCNDVKTR